MSRSGLSGPSFTGRNIISKWATRFLQAKLLSAFVTAYVIACPFMSISDTAEGHIDVYDTVRLACLEPLLKTQINSFGDTLCLLSEAAQRPSEMQRFKVSGPEEVRQLPEMHVEVQRTHGILAHMLAVH